MVEAPVEPQHSDVVHSAIDTGGSADAVDLNSIVTVTVRNATGSAVKVCHHAATGAMTGGH